MPLALSDLQAAFAAHLQGHDRPELEGAVVGDRVAAAARLRIYRNHVRESLAAALGATFATVQVLVGEDFFRGLALAFVAESPPQGPVLSEYGADFPAFVAGWPAAQDLPYLADVARLDWALNLAFHAPAGPRLSAADLVGLPMGELPSQRLVAAPGTAVVTSAWPLDRIWRVSQPGASAAEEGVDLQSGGVALLVLRRPDDAGFAALSAGEKAMVAALLDGFTLGEAAEAGSRGQADFDLATAFARLLALQAFAAVQ